MTVDTFFRSQLRTPDQLNDLAVWTLTPVNYFFGQRLVEIVNAAVIERAPLRYRYTEESWKMTAVMVALFIPSLILGTIVRSLSVCSSPQIRASLAIPAQEEENSELSSSEESSPRPLPPKKIVQDHGWITPRSDAEESSEGENYDSEEGSDSEERPAFVTPSPLARPQSPRPSAMTRLEQQFDMEAFYASWEGFEPQVPAEIFEKASRFFTDLLAQPDSAMDVAIWLDGQLAYEEYDGYFYPSFVIYHLDVEVPAESENLKQLYTAVIEKLFNLKLEMYLHEGLEQFVRSDD